MHLQKRQEFHFLLFDVQYYPLNKLTIYISIERSYNPTPVKAES